MPATLPRLGLAGAVSSLGVSACCVMPTALVLLGAGGSWLAVFARIAALGYYVAGAASLILVAAWAVVLHGRTLPRNGRLLGLGTGISAVAWLVLANEARLNDYLIGLL
jgi:mercuric ion transport protein